MTRPHCLPPLLGLCLLIGGCDNGPAPSAESGIGPPPPPPVPAAEAGPSPGPPTSSPPSPTSGAEIALFVAANRQVLEVTESIRTLLAATKDEDSANEVAEKLPSLTSRWEAEQKAATALFLTLSADQQRQALAEGQQAAATRARPGQEDLIALIQRLAASPQRPTLEPALANLRDTLLSQHSIYAPVTFRRRLAEKLGDIGSPLP